MTESVLKALMRLFAIVAQVHSEDKYEQVKAIIESYLQQLVNRNKIYQYLIMYDFYYSGLYEREAKTGEKKISLFSVKSIIICEQINKVLENKQKILVLLHLFEIINLKDKSISELELDFIKTISLAFKFDDATFQDSKSFILDSYNDIPNKDNILLIDSNQNHYNKEIKHVYRDYLKGKLTFLYIRSTNSYLFRHIDADDQLYLNSRKIVPYRTYLLEKGSTIKSPILDSIYYGDITRIFLQAKINFKLHFSVDKLSFRFSNSNDGIYQFSLHEETGQLIGIMGGSGVGKSTMLNLLNGNYYPNSGRVLINGYDVHYEKQNLEGIIGYIPQDDLLIEELSVYKNLYFNAKLCFRYYSREKIEQTVNKVLSDLDLSDIKDFKVGSPLNKFISGGQRKRLNIALELIREPYVLFVDEPTSGLSSNDSEVVIDLLKEQALKGKMVIVNIHQPSSRIYKQLDKLLVLDKGGRTVYYGNPLDALVYFKTENQLINAEESECLTCGNVNPEQVLQILESKRVDDFGRYTKERLVSAEEWYFEYQKNSEPRLTPNADIKLKIPGNDFKVPGRIKQLKIFSIRNLLSKLTDKQYLLINLFEAPLLAVVLGIFTKYTVGTANNPFEYIFGENVNIPVYIFMSIIVSLFLGLMVSAEEIFHDRKIIKREAFLKLSHFSYYNSKVIFLIVLSAIQCFSFVLIGNLILDIKDMFFRYWVILFVCSVFSNILGLNISASLKSIVAIYIIIPLLLVPQILLGGAMVNFDKMNKRLSSQKYVPVVGDLITSRWAYEALMVHQFKNNKFQTYFYNIEYDESKASYRMNYLIPELISRLNECERNIKTNVNTEQTNRNLKLLKNELLKIINEENIENTGFMQHLTIYRFNVGIAQDTRSFLDNLKKFYSAKLDKTFYKKDQKMNVLLQEYQTNSGIIEFKQKYYNNNLADIVLNKRETQKIVEYKDEFIQHFEPVFLLPESNFGRAHFYAPQKMLFNHYVDTYWFNLIIISLMILILYILLIFGIFKKLISLSESVNFMNLSKRIQNAIHLLYKPLVGK